MGKLLLVYYEPLPSGQTTHVLSLTRGLDKDKYDITVVLPDHLRNPLAAFRQAGAKVVPLPMGKFFWKFKSILSLISLVRDEKNEIVHIHSQEAGMTARVAARIAGAKAVLYTPQCTDIRRKNWYWLYRRIERLLSHATDKIISVNEADRLRMIQWGIRPEKIITIKNGIDLDSLPEPFDAKGLRRKLDLEENNPVVMQVGRLNEQKNPLSFIRGAGLVIQEQPDARFVLIGDGPLKQEVIDSIGTLGLEDKVRLLGWQDNAQALIAAADIITLTSRWEGLPYVLLEGMAWSRPIVATEVNGCPEMIRDGITGYLVTNNDEAAWAKAVLKLIRNPEESAKMGQRGNELLKKEFSLQSMIRSTENLYDELIVQ